MMFVLDGQLFHASPLDNGPRLIAIAAVRTKLDRYAEALRAALAPCPNPVDADRQARQYVEMMSAYEAELAAQLREADPLAIVEPAATAPS